MGIPIVILTPQGVTDAPYTADSFADAAAQEPQGVYTVARTFNGDKALLLDDHLDRLEHSAELENIPLKLDRPALRSALRGLIKRAGYPESRFRLVVPRIQPDQVIISLEPFKAVPPEIIEHGAKVITAYMERPNPVAKTTRWMSERKSTVERFPPEVYEGILVSPDGKLLEGLSSNFYAVIDGKLRTAEDDRVLSGIARNIVLIVAPDVLPVVLDAPSLEELDSISEMMLTSSGRGIVPIVSINDWPVGDGKPGPITQRLRERYEAWATAHVEAI